MTSVKFVLATLLVCLIMGAPALAQPDSLASLERDLLAKFRKNPKEAPLQQLAETREEAGLFDKAEATWSLLVKNYGAQPTIYFNETKDLTYAQLATWMRHRLARKRNLAKNGKATNQQYRRAWHAQPGAGGSSDYAAERTIDLDGDGIEEVILMKYRQNSDEPRFINIYKWDGIGNFIPVFSTLQDWTNPLEMEYQDYQADEMKDGFAEVLMITKKTPQQIDGYLLLFNGREFIGKRYGA